MSEAQELRQLFEDLGPVFESLFMPQTCTVLRKVTRREDGAVITDWADGETVPCSVYQPGSSSSATEQRIAGREALVVVYRVSMPLGTQVSAKDQLRIDDGRVFEIQAVPIVSVASTLVVPCVAVQE